MTPATEGLVISMVREMALDETLELPAASVALAVMEWPPSARFACGVRDQIPEPFAVVEPIRVVPAR